MCYPAGPKVCAVSTFPSQVVCPPESRHCYSEKVAYMPHCYFVNDYKQAHQDIVEEEEAGVLPTRASAGLPDDKIIYACSNQVRGRARGAQLGASLGGG